MVLVIVGVLSAFAVPRFFKSADEARKAEAEQQLQVIRSAQLRYFQDQGTYAAALSQLAMSQPSGGRYTYSVQSADATNFVIKATPAGGGSTGPIFIDKNGLTYSSGS